MVLVLVGRNYHLCRWTGTSGYNPRTILTTGARTRSGLGIDAIRLKEAGARTFLDTIVIFSPSLWEHFSAIDLQNVKLLSWW